MATVSSTQSTALAPNSKTSKAVAFRYPGAVSPTEAAKYAARLISFYRKDDVGDPEVFAAGMIAVMSLYPAHVLQEVVSPTVGIPEKLKFLPSIAEVSDACKGVCIRIATEARREEQMKALPDRAAETTPEQAAKGCAMFKAVSAEISKAVAAASLNSLEASA